MTGAHVVLAARNADALAEAEDWVHAEVPHATTSTVALDLTSLAAFARPPPRSATSPRRYTC